MKIDWIALAATAEGARARAYAPYSGYRVGCALLARRPGREPEVFLGANVENASYGLSVCAERTAIAAAVLAGATKLVAIAIATQGPTPGAPCGMCRQVIAEFARDVPVALVVKGRVRKRSSSSRLLPGAFRGNML